MDMITLVSCVIVDEDCNLGRATTYLSDGEALEDAIEQVKSEAMDDFNDNGGSANCRCIVNVNEVPKPALRATIVRASVPQGEEDAIITATVA